MHSDLIDKGVTPRKSLTLKPPVGIPERLTRHWIRGYFDGDGCVHFREKRRRLVIIISGTNYVLSFIQNSLGFGRIRPQGRISRFEVSKEAEVKRFYNYIYKGATPYLERKRSIFERNL